MPVGWEEVLFTSKAVSKTIEAYDEFTVALYSTNTIANSKTLVCVAYN